MLSKGKEGGFTLLEVMIALAVISISFIVLLQAQNANMVRSAHADRMVRAALIGEKMLAEVDSTGDLAEGEWEGEEEADKILFFWTKRIEPSPVGELKKVTVTVGWEGEEESPFTLETYRML